MRNSGIFHTFKNKQGFNVRIDLYHIKSWEQTSKTLTKIHLKSGDAIQIKGTDKDVVEAMRNGQERVDSFNNDIQLSGWY